MANRKKGGIQDKLHCSFCGKKQDTVRRLVAGPGVYICDECIELCNEIIAEEAISEQSEKQGVLHGNLPKPEEIKRILDQYIVDQEKAKRILAVAVYNHYKRIGYTRSKDDVELDKSNILLIGPTGSGKTLMAQTLARLLEVPFAIVDATALTEAGYVGEDVENILLRLIQNANGDVQRAEIGIIYVDEIDKIARKVDNPSITRDVSGEGVQQALLKIIEGTTANVPPQGGRKHPHQDFITINTKNILFICGGAFVGLEQVLNQRLGKREIGFARLNDEKISFTQEKSKDENLNLYNDGKQVKNKKSKTVVLENKKTLSVKHEDILQRNIKRAELFENIVPDDLMKYGLIPEFVGRLPVLAVLQDLNLETLRKIFTQPKNSLAKQYKKILELENVKLSFTEEAIISIAEKAIERDAGARGLRSIMEKIMTETMFMLPSRKDIAEVVITPAVINNGEQPVLAFKKENRKSSNIKKEKLA